MFRFILLWLWRNIINDDDHKTTLSDFYVADDAADVGRADCDDNAADVGRGGCDDAADVGCGGCDDAVDDVNRSKTQE